MLTHQLGIVELPILVILRIPEQENKVLLLAGLQRERYKVGRNGTPPVRHRVASLALGYRLRAVKAVVEPEEGLAVGVEAIDSMVGEGIVGIVVATLFVLRLVVDGGAIYLHLARAPVALEVLHIRGSIPKTPLHKREHAQLLALRRTVGDTQSLHLSMNTPRHKE